MRRVYAKHLPYTNGHYGIVFNEMELTDGPTIRVMDFGGDLCAIEGSHRLAACHEQKLIPKLVIEIEDTDLPLPDDHWTRVKANLPFYDFPEVRVLDMREVAKKHLRD